MRLYEASDDFMGEKSMRFMRIGLLFLILCGKLPKWFVKRIKKYITKLNKDYNKID